MVDRFTKILEVKMKPHEVDEAGRSLAQLTGDLEDLIAAQDEHKRAMAKAKKEAEREIARVAQEVRTGLREAAVECENRVDAVAGVVITVRMDTGQVIASRPALPGEVEASAQTGLFDVGSKKGKGKKANVIPWRDDEESDEGGELV